MKKIFLIIVITLSACASAQFVESDIMRMDLQRIQQITDSNSTDTRSFFFRSTSMGMNEIFNNKKKKISLTQVGYTLHANNNLTLSDNDGTLIPATGLQQRITIGAFFKWKGLQLQIQPEFVTAANTEPTVFTGDPYNRDYWPRYYLFTANKIDMLSRFGTDAYSKLYPGQSTLSYQFKNTSIGLSTENLWWGPGIRNSLILTNNAPGFLHLTWKTHKPIPTKIGNWEFQFLWGWLQKKPFQPQEDELMRPIWTAGIIAKPDTAGRSIFGYNFAYNPKWIPNFFIGFSGVSYFYTRPVDATPYPDLILPFENKVAPARLGSIYLRYKMPKENAELYVEYGRGNRWAAPWNIFGDTIPTAYIAGFRKLFPLHAGKHNSFISLHAEWTQLQLPDARLIFNPANPRSIPKTNSWYTHPYIQEGYTNEGQVMGASIGPGSTSQTLYLSWIKGKKRIGLQVERVANNNDFTIYTYATPIIGYGLTDRYWINMNYGLNAQWDVGPWLLSGFFQYTNALNYRWVKLDAGFSQPSAADRTNSRFSISLTRFFGN